MMTVHEAVIPDRGKRKHSYWILTATTFLFILLQSVCTAVMAISSIGLLLGIASFAATSLIPGFLFSMHAQPIRLPMMLIAILSSIVNLYVIWRTQSLRSRPAAQWRMQPIPTKQRRMETAQIVLSISTLVLVVLESLAHHHLHGSF